MRSIFQTWDDFAFEQINQHWTSPWLDSILPIIRNQDTWIPLYLFMILFVWANAGLKKMLIYVLFVGLLITLSDQTSSHLIKPWVGRMRPCGNPLLQAQLRLLLGYCPVNASFPSSHAANHFALASFFYGTLRPWLKRWGYLFFIWAAVICYAQVYVGIHYPSDVLAGSFLGGVLGYTMGWLYKKTAPLKIS